VSQLVVSLALVLWSSTEDGTLACSKDNSSKSPGDEMPWITFLVSLENRMF